MKLKWSKTGSKYFSKPILTAEYNHDWIPWLLVAMCSLAGLGYLLRRW